MDAQLAGHLIRNCRCARKLRGKLASLAISYPGAAAEFHHVRRYRTLSITESLILTSRDETGALEAIDGRRAGWIAAINAGDADAFVSALTDDAVWLPWQQVAIRGKERIRSWLAAPFAEFTYDYSVTDVHVRLAGEWAVERARFTTRARTQAGDAAPIHHGTYTLLWRFTPSAGWLIERYIDQTEEDAALYDAD